MENDTPKRLATPLLNSVRSKVKKQRSVHKNEIYIRQFGRKARKKARLL